MKKKVLIVTRNFPPEICGVGDYSWELLRRLPNEGIEANILALYNEKSNVFAKEQGLMNRFFSTKSPFSFNLVGKIMKVCEENNIKTIFWQYVPNSYSARSLPFYLIPLFLIIRIKGYSQTIYFHEVSVRAWGHGLKQFVLALGQQIISRSLAMIAQNSITSIDFYKRYLWPFSAKVIPVGANIYADQQTLEKTFKKPDKFSIFCFSSRVDIFLIQAVAKLQSELKKPCILIAGGKCAKQHKFDMQKVADEMDIGEMITWKGELPMNDLAKEIVGCDVFFQPQAVENNDEGGISAKNGTIIAAMSMGKPIIATCGDMTDHHLFRNNENIEFVEFGKMESYKSSLLKLFQRPEFLEKLSVGAKKSYSEFFSWEIIVKNIANIIK